MKKWLARVIVVLVMAALPAAPVLAFITAPTSITISNVQAVRNLDQSGDMLILFHYSMPYESDNYSETPASRSIMFRLLDDDGSTVLQQGVPYVNPYFESNGYGEGTGAFYLETDNVTAHWGDELEIQIVKLPAFFDPAETQGHTITDSEYVDATTQASNRALAQEYILLECDDLASAYQDTGIILKVASDSGIVLSPYGETYYRGVIPGLQALIPDLFFIQTLVPEEIGVTEYDTSQMDVYTDRLVGDDVGDGMTNMGTLLGVGGPFFAGMLTFGGCGVLCVWTTKRGWGAELGMAGSALVVGAMALLVGDVVYTVMMIVSLLAAIGIVWLFLLKRA